MTDIFTKKRRSQIMKNIRSKNTTPEVLLRRFLSGYGFRYRLHAANLPGKPDIVFPGKKKVILINGCFWHMHNRCRIAHFPKSKREYWVIKLINNKKRDARNKVQLTKSGWKYLVLWECEIKKGKNIENKILNFLDN